MLTDVAHQRCCSSHLYGMPAKIATTDKFQGQQNDYILLSLVRTKSVGHGAISPDLRALPEIDSPRFPWILP